MKAAICTRYGPPEVIQIQDVPKPIPNDSEVLVRVRAAVVGPSDCAFRKGEPFIVKLIYGLSKPRISIHGVEFSGEIEEIGKDVTSFKVGDQVFGMSPNKLGALAQYLCLDASKTIATKPSNLDFEQSVAVCDGATTALTFLRDKAKIHKGQKILINGASGAVGSYAVQLAKYFGTEVIGVCSTSNTELVKSLGADSVIDYTKEDFTKNLEAYDVIFDAVGKSSFSKCKKALKKGGIYLTTFPTLTIVFQMLWTSVFGNKKAKFTTAGLLQNKDNLDFLTKLAEERKIKPNIDKVYSLDEIIEAHKYVELGHKKGNVVLRILDL